MIAIIDYGAGNIRSVEHALEHLGIEYKITGDADEILRADRVILPGVGAFGSAMKKLSLSGLIPCIREVVKQGIPLLGICLGLQLLFEESEEAPGVAGLAILKGKIHRFPQSRDYKVPHVGWNSVELVGDGFLFEGFQDKVYQYFVHSYYLVAEDRNIVKGTAEYGVRIDATIQWKNVYGCQFHPEKSGQDGLLILRNFCGK